MKKIISILILLTISTYSTSLYNKGLTSLEENNTSEAIKYFTEASQNNHAKAMYKLGLIYEKHDENRTALEWYQKAKLAGNLKAQYRSGVLSCKMGTYQYLDDFESYAQTSSKIVQYDLAVCFLQKGDKNKALEWFRIVANKGDAQAQYRVAILVKNKKLKRKWLKKSAKNNYQEAQFELGKTLFKAQQLKNAKYWLNKAKNNGSTKAKIYLKRIEELGL